MTWIKVLLLVQYCSTLQIFAQPEVWGPPTDKLYRSWPVDYISWCLPGQAICILPWPCPSSGSARVKCGHSSLCLILSLRLRYSSLWSPTRSTQTRGTDEIWRFRFYIALAWIMFSEDIITRSVSNIEAPSQQYIQDNADIPRDYQDIRNIHQWWVLMLPLIVIFSRLYLQDCCQWFCTAQRLGRRLDIFRAVATSWINLFTKKNICELSLVCLRPNSVKNYPIHLH